MRELLRLWQSELHLLNLAIPLLTALVAIRLIVHALRYAVRPSETLKAWERSISWLIWIGVALAVVVELLGVASLPWLHAVGDVTGIPMPNGGALPKAGVFAEGAARTVAEQILVAVRGGPEPEPYPGRGSCYIEFGRGEVGRVDVQFLHGPAPSGTFQPPSRELVAEKARFGSSRLARWFGKAS